MIEHLPTLTEHERSLAAAIAARSKSSALAAALIAEVAEIFEVSTTAITGPNRLRKLVDARTLIAQALLDRGWTLEDIGDALHRDHSTVVNLYQRMYKNDELRSIARELAA